MFVKTSSESRMARPGVVMQLFSFLSGYSDVFLFSVKLFVKLTFLCMKSSSEGFFISGSLRELWRKSFSGSCPRLLNIDVIAAY